MRSSVGLAYALHRPRTRGRWTGWGGRLGRLGRPLPTPPALHRTLLRLRPIVPTRPRRTRAAFPPTLQIPPLPPGRAVVSAGSSRSLLVRRVPGTPRTGRRLLLLPQFHWLGPTHALVGRLVQIRARNALRLQLSVLFDVLLI